MIPKTKQRLIFLEIRKSLQACRRAEAAEALKIAFQKSGTVLAFSSFASEINLGPLNARLAAENRLFLPRIEGEVIVPYRVEDPATQLVRSPLGFQEPNKALCQKADLSEIDIMLVPGIVFDSENYRLGYGKGYYDRLLSEFDGWSIAVGFKEQFSPIVLPRDPWDLPTNEQLLV